MSVKRQEFLFVYESINANANGDPLNENRPRIDEETGLQEVTLYRFKRTIRDYLKLLNVLNQEENKEILYKEEWYEDKGENYLKPLKKILKENNSLTYEAILQKFIDVRLFGGLFGVEKENLHLQGPVQINYGRSYHEVKEKDIQISAVMPSKEGAKNGTLGMSYVVPYAVIGTDGTINQFNGNKKCLTEQDVELMFKALWEGTRELKTTSKNQNSLLLVKVTFKEDYPFACIGNLQGSLKLTSDKNDLELRNTTDYMLDVSLLADKLNNAKEKIESVEVIKDGALKLCLNGEEIDNLQEVLEFEVVEEID